MEQKTKKYENLVRWIDANAESFTALKASAESNMPNKNTTLHTCNGFVEAGLLSASKSNGGTVFTKTPEWNVQKAIDANKARIHVKVEKRKRKIKPAQKPNKNQNQKRQHKGALFLIK